MSYGDANNPHSGDFVVPMTFAGLVGFLVGGASRALVTEAGIQAGSVADWVAALAATGALVAAVVAARAAYRAIRVDVDRDERAQAELIAVWPTAVDPIREVLSGKITAAESIHLALRNASALPVFDVVVDVCFNDRRGMTHSALEKPVTATVLNPNQEPLIREKVALGGRQGYVPMKDLNVSKPEDIPGAFEIELRFTDMSGTRWRRTRNGRPRIDTGKA